MFLGAVDDGMDRFEPGIRDVVEPGDLGAGETGRHRRPRRRGVRGLRLDATGTRTGPKRANESVETVYEALRDVEIDDLVADGEMLAVRFAVSGTHEGELLGISRPGNEMDVEVMAVQRIQERTWRRATSSTRTKLEQLGVFDAPEP